MRKLLLSLFIASAGFAQAQTYVSDFESLSLSGTDTFYVNFSAPGSDVGFLDGFIHFPCVYDTAFGYSFWNSGFAYSNMTDSVTSGIINQYAAKAASGHSNSANYAVGYGAENYVLRVNNVSGLYHVLSGFYVTNSTYAYNSMRYGDAFGKKFGGVTGDDPDWFKLRVFGFSGAQITDSAEFYLADFRDTNNANDYIVKDWQWMDLSSLGHVDSVVFRLSSSDTGQWGMNTPAYFCMDDFTMIDANGVATIERPYVVKVYPNPATNFIIVEGDNAKLETVMLTDVTGQVLSSYKAVGEKLSIPVNQLPNGVYFLRLNNGAQKQTVRFIKQ
ncbi:MAG TPA: DUF4465 domain-containing protein [Flavipsychrobacter sp.]|nr:DUF4465 domain-containing protein [Flavipsychrobacter sp.]